ncbi:hypothetical protein [Arthrobacter sp. H20]|uniref:hypothetical protein n=1 Tax=Arthrobacter sp. H20 TaxID=1267981 RepID=UPI0004BB6F72|nr:hypothetical protein [Arthrobacter sp. H20]
MEKINSIAARTWRWLRANRDWLPAVVVLACVVAFWSVGLVGGLAMLRGAQSPMATLIGLYFMLALIAISITVTVLAASDLTRRITARKNSPRR